jgi:hypothetical protein
MNTSAATMEPLSARVPSDVYLWLAQLQVDGATTNSDKLRVLLGQLKRQYDGALDFTAAHSWARDLTARLRDRLARVEAETGRHSEVMSTVLDHGTSLIAHMISSEPSDAEQASKLEDALVRRAFALAESLLRQGMTEHASAFDSDVVSRHMLATTQLAAAIQTLKGASHG